MVEVVIALGIVAFAITALLGLLTGALQSDSSSASDTFLASMSQQVFNSLRALPYATLSANANYHYYFDVDGSELADAKGLQDADQSGLSAADKARAIYHCTVTLTDDPDLKTGTGVPATAKTVQMVFAWPCSAASPPSKSIFQGAIANHGS